MSNQTFDHSQSLIVCDNSEETRKIYRALSTGEPIKPDDEVLTGMMWTMDYYASAEHAQRIGSPYDPAVDLPHRRLCQPPLLTEIAKAVVVKQ